MTRGSMGTYLTCSACGSEFCAGMIGSPWVSDGRVGECKETPTARRVGHPPLCETCVGDTPVCWKHGGLAYCGHCAGGCPEAARWYDRYPGER